MVDNAGMPIPKPCVATANVSNHVKAESTRDIVLVVFILPKVMLLYCAMIALLMAGIDWFLGDSDGGGGGVVDE